MSVEDFDVVVAGGGPGGSTVATLVAMQGHRVLLLEKEVFPRYQIGESLLPATVHGVCRMLGVSDELANAGFPIKRGGTFRWGARPEPWTFHFGISAKMAGSTSHAYQVERARFDDILLKNAKSKGVVVREGCSVNDVVEDGERVTGARYTDPDGNEREVSARFVIDASGNKSRLYSKVGGSRNYSEFFRSLALFGYFEGGKRLPEPVSGNILSVAFDNGWFWYIPLSDTLTSVGAVVRREDADKIQGDREKALNALIAECPLISDYLSNATRVTTGRYGELRVRKDYSYQQESYWRPGMILVGDAACFVDPVFSSGVHLATYSALLAARSINSVLAGDLDEKTALNEFESRYRREYGVFYEFLVSFYQMNVNEESYFWQAKKVTQNQSTDIESFVELIGGVSSGETALTAADRIAARSAEFAAAVDKMAAGDGDDMVPMFKSAVVQQAMQEAGQVQMKALLGEDAEPELPLFPGGLVTSPDGMKWLPHHPV
ncbi:tryptophan 7-halogenase [Amycolatopsis regifaucium]|uniref:Tryptophan halogenase n=1 Tax=Amycolatopsis regifaucium TaxID=546365 RepID=A0A154M6F4_9PSEU|nr:tryptophan 7-halogenase [Amycolatopsis regifaucium]KZB80198.1 tryptophan halogenase [Amycolatopsis regifaucium]OKA09430.1 tryptophan halogenase [Amycolatopsis regifaucium]SFH61000.1 halogenation protein CepH [Amycolatopsis regifaucium]